MTDDSPDVHRMTELSRLAAAKRRREPYDGTFPDFLGMVGMVGPSWKRWRVFWAACDGLPLDAEELEIFQHHTGRQSPPAHAVLEAWPICGRRSGKTRNMAARAFWTAIRRDWRSSLAPGELAVIPFIAADRKQARSALGYVRGMAELPAFRRFVDRSLRDSVEFHTGISMEVHTCSYRSTRGYACPMVCCDETAFWSTEGSAEADIEVLTALRPTQSTFDDRLLLAGSTPYSQRGVLFDTWQRCFGQEDPDTLVWVGTAREMNPALDQRVVDRAMEADPQSAAAEYLAQFRSDVAAFMPADALSAAIVTGRYELPRAEGVRYFAFTDPSGGSQDSWTLGIGHLEGETAVLDVLRERRPPFSPANVAQEFATVLLSYGVREVTGDKYGGEFPRELFAKHGVRYRTSDETKTDIYLAALPLLMTGRLQLLDQVRMRQQLQGLERRTGSSGKDSVDHPPGGSDDLSNVALGVLVLAAKSRRSFTAIKIPDTHQDPLLVSPLRMRNRNQNKFYY